MVRNCSTDRAFEVPDLERVMKERDGLDLDVWSVEKWLEAATDIGMDRSLDNIIRSTVKSRVPFPLMRLRKRGL